jgi:hypothetical protein
MDAELERNDNCAGDFPLVVTASILSLQSDLAPLNVLFGPTAVPEVSICSRNVVTIVYGFGDASGTRLGASFTWGSGFNFRISSLEVLTRTQSRPIGRSSPMSLNSLQKRQIWSISLTQRFICSIITQQWRHA